jgi:hypothetical protein
MCDLSWASLACKGGVLGAVHHPEETHDTAYDLAERRTRGSRALSLSAVAVPSCIAAEESSARTIWPRSGSCSTKRTTKPEAGIVVSAPLGGRL